MWDRRRLIEAADANEPGAKFKRAKKTGAKNGNAIQVPILLPWAIFLSSNLPVESQQADDATLPTLVPASRSATSPNRGELRAFPMNDRGNRAAAKNL